MNSSYGVEKGTTIRYPSTANLMVDSADRPNNTTTTPWNFQITKTNSIMNGFFTRVGTTEVVLEWCEPNIVGGEISLDISGATVRSIETFNYDGFFTVESLLQAIATDASGTNGVVFTASVTGDGYGGLGSTGGKFQVVDTPLAEQLNLPIMGGLSNRKNIVGCPDLRFYRYLDFVSQQITYAQDLKDNSTQPINRDVLCRWYMAEDSPEQLDGFGYPILMGYKAFVRRRLFNPPKQIKWDNNLPVGNVSFQVYRETGSLVGNSNNESNWLMTLQFSEN